MKWPRITLVTANLNQGRFLETAIRSVLSQRYPNLEYFVLDGGSEDGSREIIDRYRGQITQAVCRPDGGQAAALQQGLVWGTGEIFHWLNADDALAPGALRRVARAFGDGSAADAVAAGWTRFSDEGEQEPEFCAGLSAKKMIRGGPGVLCHQPGLWLRRRAALACGGIDRRYDYAFDWDLALRYLHGFPKVRYLKQSLIYFREHPHSKTATVGAAFPRERVQILRGLLENEAYRDLHDACRDRIALELWWRELGEVMTDETLSPPLKAWTILRAAVRDPATRLSRMTAGALRRTLWDPVRRAPLSRRFEQLPEA